MSETQNTFSRSMGYTFHLFGIPIREETRGHRNIETRGDIETIDGDDDVT